MGPAIRTTAAAAVALLSALPALPASAEVFHSKESALNLAFPGADRVEAREAFLSPDDKAAIEARAGAKVESRLVGYYAGIKDGAPIGYAFIDTHVVRTMPETFMVVVAPDGTVRSTAVLAFHEPPEYLPPPRWFRRFDGRALGPSLRVGGDVDVVAGATLSSQAVTAAVRRVLATWERVIAPKSPPPAVAAPAAPPKPPAP